jgi:hypothetical protein
MAKAPPTLVVISTLASPEPAPPAENESELHLFPAAESPYDFADVGSGSNELPVGEVGAPPIDSNFAAHDASATLHDPNFPPHDFGAPPYASAEHVPPLADRPPEDFGAAIELPLELSADDLGHSAPADDHLSFSKSLLAESPEPQSTDAAAEAEHDFLTSLDDSEPPTGDVDIATPRTAAHLMAEETQSTELGATESDWFGEPSTSHSAELELPGDEPGDLAPQTPGDTLAEQASEELSFGEEEESFAIEEEQQQGFDTVNLDSGFEERRAVPDGVEGYSLDQASEEEASEDELAAITDGPARPARRKPSFITGIIMYLLGLLFVLPATYLGLMWGASMDPLKLAPSIPGILVPAALNTKNQLGASIKPSQLTPVPESTEDQPPVGTPANDVPGGASPAQDGSPRARTATPDAADENAADDADLVGDRAADSDAGAEDAAAMAADAATHDPDASPADTDMADSDAAPADADAPETAADLPADRDATADNEPTETEPADSDAADMIAKDTAADADAGDTDAADMPADSDAKDTAAKDDAAADDAPAKKTVAKESDESPVDAALDEAMADKDEPAADAEVGLRDGIQYTPADVDKALTEVASASKALDEAGKAEMNDAAKAELKKTKGQFYRKLYQLAEVATFTPAMAASAEAEQGSQQDLVDHTLAGSAASPSKFSEVGKAAGKWLDAVKGKEHQGIVLSGTLKSTAQRGKVFESQILLTDGQRVVTVLSPAAPSVEPAGAVLVWGSVADDPAEKIAGYEGDAKTAIWTTAIEAAPEGAAPESPASQPAATGAPNAKTKSLGGN